MTLVNLFGQIVYEAQARQKEVAVRVEMLPAGVYVLLVKVNGERLSRRVEVVR